jgi:hypothetical protein
MKRLYNSTIRDKHKDKIFEIILENSNGGITQQEIINTSGFTRQTVSPFLRDLKKENRIYFVKSDKDARIKVYFVQDRDIGNIHLFSRAMDDAGITIIDPDLINIPEELLYENNSKTEPIYSLYNLVNGITVSDKYCETRFAKHDIKEKYLFEFVNRVGAFIAYIFIESMRPLFNNTGVTAANKRNRLGSILVKNSINLADTFERFCLLFAKTGLIKDEHSKPFFELDEHNFEKLIETFEKVYPKIYHGIERYWISSRKAWMDIDKHLASTDDCPHKWEKTYLYKFGKCYECRKCNKCVSSPVSNKASIQKYLS